jgi:DNA-binding transcriptional ArsR family regulator
MGAGKRETNRRGTNKRGTVEAPYVIKDAAVLKAVADPLRQHLLALLDRPKTVKELADATGRPPDRLYYHLGVLEKAGLIAAEEARGQERRYTNVDQALTIDPDLPIPPAVAGGLVTGVLERAQREYALAARARARTRKRGERGERPKAILGLTYHCLDEAQYAELCKRMEELVAEYEQAADVNQPQDKGTPVFGVLRGAWRVDLPGGKEAR